MMRIVVLIFACLCLTAGHCLGEPPAVMNQNFTWDNSPPEAQVKGYFFYEKAAVGTNRFYLGFATTNRFTVTNANVLVPHSYGVTATNFNGESDMSTPVVTPSNPRPPTGLQQTSASMVVPTNSFTVEGTGDLVSWKEQIRVVPLASNYTRLTFLTEPSGRLFAWRQKISPPPPPLP